MATWPLRIKTFWISPQQRGLIRPRDLTERGLPTVALTRLVRQGRLQRVGRGLYALPDRPVSEHNALAEVARKHPQAIVCLLSALRFHDLTTQSPFEVWLAIPNKARAPKMDYPPLRIVRFSGAALTAASRTMSSMACRCA